MSIHKITLITCTYLHSHLHSTHNWRPNSLSYPIPVPAPQNVCHHYRLQPQSPRRLLGLTFPEFDLAPKRNEKFGNCGLDLVSHRWISWSPWHGFCGRWEAFGDLHYITHYLYSAWTYSVTYHFMPVRNCLLHRIVCPGVTASVAHNLTIFLGCV